jgi:DNA-binding transcriptional MerR regulator
MTEINTQTTKSDTAFRTISEVAEDLGVQQHVLRFWETKFSQVKPMKRGGGRRYYRPEDVALLRKIHTLLYAEGYTIKGVQKLLKGVSKSQVLAEQKSNVSQQASKAFGAGLAKIEGPDMPPVAVEEAVGAVSVPPEHVVVLKSVLDELLEMREQVEALLAERASEDEQAA